MSPDPAVVTPPARRFEGKTAIVTGADFLPNLTRCLQGVSATAHISRSQVDSRGGTAEVILAFKVP